MILTNIELDPSGANGFNVISKIFPKNLNLIANINLFIFYYLVSKSDTPVLSCVNFAIFKRSRRKIIQLMRRIL